MLAREVGFIDGPVHKNHLPGSLFAAGCRRRTCSKSPVPPPVPVASGTWQSTQFRSQRGGKEPHRPHEFVQRNSFEDLDVLQDIFGHRLFLRRGFCAGAVWGFGAGAFWPPGVA